MISSSANNAGGDVTPNFASAGGTNGCYTATAYLNQATALRDIIMGGFTGSAQDCLTFAVDGYVITGIQVLNRFMTAAIFALVTTDANCGLGATRCWNGTADIPDTAS
jgi:hypothetical protein